MSDTKSNGSGLGRHDPQRSMPGPLASALPIEQYLAAIVSHELSNPFTALVGRVELMRNRKDLTAVLIRDLDAMRSAAERVDRLLSNLKSFSRREAPPPRPVELLPIVQSALERFRETPDGRFVEISLQSGAVSPRVLADPQLLETTLAATFETLFRRSPNVRIAEVRIRVNHGDEEVAVVIIDDGPEISAEDMDRVFHPFGGQHLSAWWGVVALAYSYYVIRAWGGTFRFQTETRGMVSELCLALQV